MIQLRSNIPEGLEQLVKYFDQTYVSESFQRVQLSPAADGTVQPIRMRRIFPVSIPTIWHVHDMTVNGGSRTNNICEAWNRGFSTLVGHAHPMIWTLIEAMCKNFSSVEGTKRFNQLGQPPRNQAPQPARLTTKEPCASTSLVNNQGTMRLNQLGQQPRNHAPQPARLTTKEYGASTS